MKDYSHDAVADFITEVQKLTPHQAARFWEHIHHTFPLLPGPTQDDVLDGMISILTQMDEWGVGNSLRGAAVVQHTQCLDVVAHWWAEARKADAEKETIAGAGGNVEGVEDVGEGQVSSAN